MTAEIEQDPVTTVTLLTQPDDGLLDVALVRPLYCVFAVLLPQTGDRRMGRRGIWDDVGPAEVAQERY